MVAHLWESSLGEDTIEVIVSFVFPLLLSKSMTVVKVGNEAAGLTSRDKSYHKHRHRR